MNRSSARPNRVCIGMTAAAISSFLLLIIFNPMFMSKASGQYTTIKERFTAEYPNAEKQLVEKIKHFSTSGQTESKTLSGKIYSTKALIVSASEGKRLILRTDRFIKGKANSQVSEVFCETPEYKFKLIKENQSEQYIINNYEEKLEADENFERLYKYYVRGATVYFGKTLSSRLSSKSIEIQNVNEIERDKQRLVQIDYQDPVRAERGSVWLNPNKGWVISEVDIIREKDDDENQVRFKSTLSYDGNESCIPSHMEYIATYVKSGKNESLQVDINNISLETPENKIFTLGGYGLPNVPLAPQAVPKPFFTFRNPILWICLVMALLSFVFSRKLKTKGLSSNHD